MKQLMFFHVLIIYLLITTSALYSAASSAAHTGVHAEEKKDMLGARCYALIPEVWNKVLDFLLGPEQHIWYSLDRTAVAPWHDGNECGLGDGGRITTYNQNALYSWYPHKNAWDPNHVSGIGGAAMKIPQGRHPIAVTANAVVLANHDTKLDVVDNATLTTCSTYPINPTTSYYALAGDSKKIVYSAHPISTHATMNLLVESHAHHPDNPTRMQFSPGMSIMPPPVMSHQGRYLAALDAYMDGAYIFDTKNNYAHTRIQFFEQSTPESSQAGLIAGKRDWKKTKTIWHLIARKQGAQSSLECITVTRLPDFRIFVESGDDYEHRDDLILEDSSKEHIDNCVAEEPLTELYAYQDNKKSIGNLAFIGQQDPLLLTTRLQNASLALDLWSHDKHILNKTIPLVDNETTVAAVTSNQGKFLCICRDHCLIVPDIRVPAQLEAMEWKPILFGTRHEKKKRNVHKLLMSPSGAWIMVREKRLEESKKRSKESGRLTKWAEQHPTMLYLGLRDHCSKQRRNVTTSDGKKAMHEGQPIMQPLWPTPLRTFAMRLYALQRMAEQGIPVTMPAALQSAIAPSHDDCVIA